MEVLSELPHRRYNPLTGDWVLVSPQRNERPWLGQMEKTATENLPVYDPECYLCPGNGRAGGKRNPDYSGTYVFDNDFPALVYSDHLVPEFSQFKDSATALACNASGICRVVCFTPRHDLTIPELPPEAMQAVVRTWSGQTEALLVLDGIQYVQVFENKGAMMGCSNPHPHSQIWATDYLPNEPAREQSRMAEFVQKEGECLICKILAQETSAQVRLVCKNDYFSALVPFWAVWPFEILVISHRHTGSLPDLAEDEINGLANLLQQVTTCYDNLFETSFPYSMGFHQSPKAEIVGEAHHLHAHFYPPLLRSATVRKFMVGFEMLAMPQRDLTPEMAAEKLRDSSGIHYKKNTLIQRAQNER